MNKLLVNDCWLYLFEYLDNITNYNLLISSKYSYLNLFGYYISRIPINYDKINCILQKWNTSIINLYNVTNLNRLILNYPNIKLLEINNELFNNPIKKKLPKKLISLVIHSKSFNQLIDRLPQTLISLKINGFMFNKPIDKLPNNLHTLSIKSKLFNKPIDKLPNNLHKLSIISESFEKPINKLPINLHKLSIISKSFDKLLDNIPKTLTTLSIYDKLFFRSINNIPKTLISLTLYPHHYNYQSAYYDSKYFRVLDKLTILKLNYHKHDIPFLINNLPSNLIKLEINSYIFDQPINKLPKTLTSFILNTKKII